MDRKEVRTMDDKEIFNIVRSQYAMVNREYLIEQITRAAGACFEEYNSKDELPQKEAYNAGKNDGRDEYREAIRYYLEMTDARRAKYVGSTVPSHAIALYNSVDFVEKINLTKLGEELNSQDFVEFLFNNINPNDMERYISMYRSRDVREKTDG